MRIFLGFLTSLDNKILHNAFYFPVPVENVSTRFHCIWKATFPNFVTVTKLRAIWTWMKKKSRWFCILAHILVMAFHSFMTTCSTQRGLGFCALWTWKNKALADAWLCVASLGRHENRGVVFSNMFQQIYLLSRCERYECTVLLWQCVCRLYFAKLTEHLLLT